MTATRTDDTRIEQSGELLAPMQIMRELRASEAVHAHVAHARSAIHDVLRGADDRMFIVVGPCSIHDPAAALDYATQAEAAGRRTRARPHHRDAGVFREAAHHRGLEGADQRPASGRELRHQRRPAAGAQAAAGNQRNRPAVRDRIPRPDLAAVHRRPGELGRDRRAHHRVAVAPPAGVRPVVPGGLQERHRRQPAGSRWTRSRRRRRATISSPSPSRATSACSAPPATRTPTSSCAAARRPTTTPPASTWRAANWPRPACASS